MAESEKYINYEAAKWHLYCEFITDKEAAKKAFRALSAIPAADVRPVVRGKWKPRDLTWGRSYYYCSACEETVDMPTAMGIPMFRYCPNCGARMEES